MFIEREMNQVKNAMKDIVKEDEARKVAALALLERAYKVGRASVQQEVVEAIKGIIPIGER